MLIPQLPLSSLCAIRTGVPTTARKAGHLAQQYPVQLLTVLPGRDEAQPHTTATLIPRTLHYQALRGTEVLLEQQSLGTALPPPPGVLPYVMRSGISVLTPLEHPSLLTPLSSAYLMLALRSPGVVAQLRERQIQTCVHGQPSGVRILSSTRIQDVVIPVPPLEAQRAVIAAYQTLVQRRRDLNAELAALLLSLAPE